MAILNMSGPWLRPEDGKFYLRKRVPKKFVAVAGKPDIRRIPLNTGDATEAERRWPDALKEWRALESEWERKLNVVSLDREGALGIAAIWAAWIAAGARLETHGLDSEAFAPLLGISFIETTGGNAAALDRLEAHAREALNAASMECTEESFALLLSAMLPVVTAAYLQAELDTVELPRPFEALRAHMPRVSVVPSVPQPPVAPRFRNGLAFSRPPAPSGNPDFKEAGKGRCSYCC